jgi:hypothetical protein
MMRKMGVLVVLAALIVVLGCTNPAIVSDRTAGDGDGILSLDGSIYGWITIYVGASSGRIHWGDSFEAGSYSDVTTPGRYSHYFDRVGVYSVRLMEGEAALAALSVPVPMIRGHVEKVSVHGLAVTVRHYGVAEVTYWIEWGDGGATAISSREYYTSGSERTHAYANPGTYIVGIRSYQQTQVDCFTVTISGE